MAKEDEEPNPQQTRRGPAPDERRIVVNGISLPRLKCIHGEFKK